MLWIDAWVRAYCSRRVSDALRTPLLRDLTASSTRSPTFLPTPSRTGGGASCAIPTGVQAASVRPKVRPARPRYARRMIDLLVRCRSLHAGHVTAPSVVPRDAN